jgi:hypothetical protein
VARLSEFGPALVSVPFVEADLWLLALEARPDNGLAAELLNCICLWIPARFGIGLVDRYGILVWSKNPIYMKSKDDCRRGPGGSDRCVTTRYITKKSAQ